MRRSELVLLLLLGVVIVTIGIVLGVLGFVWYRGRWF